MKRYWKYIVFALVLFTFAGLLFAQQQGYINFSQGSKYLLVRSGGQITVESGGTLDVASGGYLKVAGTAVTSSAAELNILDNVTATYAELNYIDGTTLGTAVASKALGLGTTRNVNYLAIDDTLITSSALIRVTTGSTIDIETGGALKIAGVQITPTSTQFNYLSGVTAGTSAASKAVVLGADSKIDALNVTTLSATSFTGARAVQVIRQITAASDTAYAAGIYKVSGDLFYARPLAQKSTLLLESATAGHWFDVMVADADSLLVTTASGDSLIDSAGAAYKTTSSVAGTVRFVGLDTTRWLMLYTLGTWTGY